MRVQFAPCGVGLGHAGRCIPVARGLRERNKDAKIIFSTYNDAVNYVRQEGFPTIEVPSMDFQVKPDGTVDFRRTAMNPGPFVAPFNFLEQVGKEIELMESFKPDIVISDSRASPLVAARILGIQTVCILNQFQVIIPRRTHYLRLAKFADVITLAIIGKIWTTGSKVIIPDFQPPYTISADNLRIPKSYRKKTKLIGPILPVRPHTLPGMKILRRKLGLHIDKPVIFIPISGPSKERTYVTNILRRIFANFPDDYEIIMSLGDPESNVAIAKNGHFKVFSWIPNRFEYMKACDIIISRAGHGTIMQAICYGKPAVLIPTPSHTEQINNVKRAVELGVAVEIQQERLNRQTLLAAIKDVTEEITFSERVQEIQEEVSVMDGLETMIKTIFELTN
jgi:UDP:flavonoid glycosyltransferase YjiC (YdhE family)